jgi:serine/threonine protein phosphatase PrpC
VVNIEENGQLTGSRDGVDVSVTWNPVLTHTAHAHTAHAQAQAQAQAQGVSPVSVALGGVGAACIDGWRIKLSGKAKKKLGRKQRLQPHAKANVVYGLLRAVLALSERIATSLLPHRVLQWPLHTIPNMELLHGAFECSEELVGPESDIAERSLSYAGRAVSVPLAVDAVFEREAHHCFCLSTATYGRAKGMLKNMPIVDCYRVLHAGPLAPTQPAQGQQAQMQGRSVDAVLIVADGSGQGERVRRATEEACSKAAGLLHAALPRCGTTTELLYALAESIQHAHQAIIALDDQLSPTEPPVGACTLLVAAVANSTAGRILLCANMGDCDAFVRSTNGAVRLATLRSNVHLKSPSDALGQIGWTFERPQARNRYWPNEATEYESLSSAERTRTIDLCREVKDVIGRLEQNELTLHMCMLAPGDMVIVCTDGVSDNLHPAQECSTSAEYVRYTEHTLEQWLGNEAELRPVNAAHSIASKVFEATERYRELESEIDRLSQLLAELEREDKTKTKEHQQASSRFYEIKNQINSIKGCKPDHTTLVVYKPV